MRRVQLIISTEQYQSGLGRVFQFILERCNRISSIKCAVAFDFGPSCRVWVVDNSPNNSSSSFTCSAFSNGIKSSELARAEVSFDQGAGLPVLGETIATFPNAESAFNKGVEALNSCKNFNITGSGSSYPATMGQMSFPAVADQSAAYAISTTIDNVNAGFDLVVFRKGNTLALVVLGDFSPDTSQLEQFVTTAANKVTGS